MNLATEQVVLEEAWIAKLRLLFQKEDLRRRRHFALNQLVRRLAPHTHIRKISDQRINILA